MSENSFYKNNEPTIKSVVKKDAINIFIILCSKSEFKRSIQKKIKLNLPGLRTIAINLACCPFYRFQKLILSNFF